MKELTGRYPSDKLIFKAIWHKDYTRSERDFLYFLINDAYKVGPYWNNIPTMEHRATCHVCEVTEDMEHILLDCDAPGSKEIWRLTKTLWLQKHRQWVKPTLPSIIGTALMTFKKPNGDPDRGADRLWRILITLSAHLVWKIRCERIIQCDEDHSIQEIQNRWKKTVNDRLRMDRAMTHPRFETKALSPRAVERTWSRIIQDEDLLPENWVRTTRVLVGIRLPEHWRGQHRHPP